MKKLLLATIVGIAGLVSTSTASASEPCYTYKLVTCYETVTVLVCKEISCTRTLVEYDHCGNPYYVYLPYTKTVEVPVTKIVAVNKWVKVYE
ncbi:MAG TPA: hypothetical protein VHR66_10400 [Gemmataceae bacterium]|jgi:hypothetical protein|nr:hypothetical protein [Gemmataceae bacterium]